jgi:hypothetical protein
VHVPDDGFADRLGTRGVPLDAQIQRDVCEVDDLEPGPRRSGQAGEVPDGALRQVCVVRDDVRAFAEQREDRSVTGGDDPLLGDAVDELAVVDHRA